MGRFLYWRCDSQVAVFPNVFSVCGCFWRSYKELIRANDIKALIIKQAFTVREIYCRKAKERLPKAGLSGSKTGSSDMDPPSQGIEKRALQAIADMEPRRIVYISCDPATMARDVNFLYYRGYELKEVQPVDMFITDESYGVLRED